MSTKKCNGCNDAVRSIPYIAYEAEMARKEKTEQRLWITIILLILLLVGSNAGWLYYESQFTDVITQEVVQEADNGSNSFIGGNVYGETDY